MSRTNPRQDVSLKQLIFQTIELKERKENIGDIESSDWLNAAHLSSQGMDYDYFLKKKKSWLCKILGKNQNSPGESLDFPELTKNITNNSFGFQGLTLHLFVCRLSTYFFVGDTISDIQSPTWTMHIVLTFAREQKHFLVIEIINAILFCRKTGKARFIECEWMQLGFSWRKRKIYLWQFEYSQQGRAEGSPDFELCLSCFFLSLPLLENPYNVAENERFHSTRNNWSAFNRFPGKWEAKL